MKENQDALSWLRGERSIFVPDENRERNVTLIDFENPDNNLFHVTDEWTQGGTVHRNRADVVFLINGIPVAVVETKSANKQRRIRARVWNRSAAIITKRRRCLPPHNCLVLQQMLDFYYGVTWNVNRKNLFELED